MKLFSEGAKDPVAVWNDPKFPEEPIRGLVVYRPKDAVAVCNDFRLTFLESDLTPTGEVIPAKEKDTCIGQFHIRFPMEQSE